jgi:cell wall-associated NlpC family hydrolase
MTGPALRRLSRLALALRVTLALLAGSAALSSVPVQAAVRAPVVSTNTLGDRVLNEAITRAGDWYSFGSAGPSYFDCSGLVYWSARQLGITLPRTTYGMLAGTAHLYRIPLSQARRGDILFFGSGHEELDTAWYHTSFGAQQTGTRVGWHVWSGWWQPTMAMRFR